MTTLIVTVIVALVVLATVLLTLRWRRESRVRVIDCPETGNREAVELDAGHAVTHALRGDDARLLKSCTRWPERADCDQPCLKEIAEAPDGCELRARLDAFYARANCALCGKAFGGQVDWAVHEPGLLDREGRVTVWEDHPPQLLEDALTDLQPVCWDCTQIQRVAQDHPDRITLRQRKGTGGD